MSDKYLAGIFDGEGSISAYINKRNQWIMRCCVEMASEEVINLFFNRFGGHIHKRKKLTVGGLQLWSWYMTGSKSCDFLNFVIDNCLLKNKMAILALPIALNMKKYVSGESRNGVSLNKKERVISKEDQEFRNEQFNKIKSLNGARSRFHEYKRVN